MENKNQSIGFINIKSFMDINGSLTVDLIIVNNYEFLGIVQVNFGRTISVISLICEIKNKHIVLCQLIKNNTISEIINYMSCYYSNVYNGKLVKEINYDITKYNFVELNNAVFNIELNEISMNYFNYNIQCNDNNNNNLNYDKNHDLGDDVLTILPINTIVKDFIKTRFIVLINTNMIGSISCTYKKSKLEAQEQNNYVMHKFKLYFHNSLKCELYNQQSNLEYLMNNINININKTIGQIVNFNEHNLYNDQFTDCQYSIEFCLAGICFVIEPTSNNCHNFGCNKSKLILQHDININYNQCSNLGDDKLDLNLLGF